MVKSKTLKTNEIYLKIENILMDLKMIILSQVNDPPENAICSFLLVVTYSKTSDLSVELRVNQKISKV